MNQLAITEGGLYSSEIEKPVIDRLVVLKDDGYKTAEDRFEQIIGRVYSHNHYSSLADPQHETRKKSYEMRALSANLLILYLVGGTIAEQQLENVIEALSKFCEINEITNDERIEADILFSERFGVYFGALADYHQRKAETEL